MRISPSIHKHDIIIISTLLLEFFDSIKSICANPIAAVRVKIDFAFILNIAHFIRQKTEVNREILVPLFKRKQGADDVICDYLILIKTAAFVNIKIEVQGAEWVGAVYACAAVK